MHKGGCQDKGEPHKEIGRLPDKSRVSCQNPVKDVFDEFHGGAAERPHGEGGDERREIGKIHFQKKREEGDGKLDEHKDKRERRKNSDA